MSSLFDELKDDILTDAAIERDAAAYREEEAKPAPKLPGAGKFQSVSTPETPAQREVRVRAAEEAARDLQVQASKALRKDHSDIVALDLLDQAKAAFAEVETMRRSDSQSQMTAGWEADTAKRATADARASLAKDRDDYAKNVAAIFGAGSGAREAMQRFDDAADRELSQRVEAAKATRRKEFETQMAQPRAFGAPLPQLKPEVPFQLRDDGVKRYNKKDFEALTRLDQEAGLAVLNSGRVDF